MAGDGVNGGRLRRIWRHRWTESRRVARLFDAAAFARIEQAIADGEGRHRGEIRFALEAELDLYRLWARMTPRERALEVFSEHRLWDTEHNTGVLVYLLWADHAVEIVADRAADRALSPAGWARLCTTLVEACRAGRPLDGVLQAIAAIHAALEPVLPIAAVDGDGVTRNDNPDELSNRPLRL